LLIAIVTIIDELFAEVDTQKMITKMIHDPEYFERIKRIFETDPNPKITPKAA